MRPIISFSPLAREAVERFATALERSVPERPLARLSARPAVSVVIPIFNAPYALDRCLRSIRTSDTPETTEIVLVDDHSSDRRVDDVCTAFAASWRRTKHLRNSRNLGFVSTVNRGIRESAPDHDVLLLNSDTEATPGWLPRLSVAAHLDDATASVCALSNAAGVYSVPRAYGDHELPPGVTAPMAQRVLGFVSERALDPVPSTSGFCMLIKRRAIERVGYLDDKLFLRGYGEENDWNERASRVGLVHRVDCSRFILHARGLSFGAAREQLKRKNSRILQVLHPGHAAALRAWEKQDALGTVRTRYGALLDELRNASEAARRAFFEAPVSLVVGTDPPPGGWDDRGARISVLCRADGTVEIDLFGVARARPPGLDARRAVFELAYRWDPTHLDVREPELRDRLRDVAGIFGLEKSFVEPASMNGSTESSEM
ncbi:glycosyltransferase family 2 protein [Sandaracinus amylolyticus]|nr:glycosyltransferase family 2 protein [Sandaracinus amylolyticus]